MQLSMILVAIRACVKLSTAAKKAYVDSTRNREILLPPPRGESAPGTNDIRTFFTANRWLLDEGFHPAADHIRQLVRKQQTSQGLSATEREDFKTYYRDCYPLVFHSELTESTRGLDLSEDEIRSMLCVRLWNNEDAAVPRWAREMAETIFDVGLDFAMNDPSICNPNTSSGKALSTLFQSLQELDLSEGELKDLPVFLLTTTLDILSKHPGVISGGQRGQALLAATAKQLGSDVARRMKSDLNVPLSSVTQWGEFVFHSLLTSGGRLAVADPGAYLGIQGKQSEAMAAAVGGALLDIVLESDSRLNLKGIFDRPALETVSDAALLVIARNPGIVTGSSNAGIRGLITEMARDMAAMEALFCREAAPEIIRLTLENTSDNLELLWPDVNKPQQHLLCRTAKETLAILGRKPDGNASWKLEFSREDAIDIVDHVFQEIQANPAWITGDSDIVNDILPVALDQVLAVIRNRGGKEITRQAARAILKSAMTSALVRAELVDETEYGQLSKPFLTACVDLALAAVFDDSTLKVKYRLTRKAGLDALMQAVLKAAEEADLGDTPAERKVALDRIQAGLDALKSDIEAGKGIDWQAFENSLK